VAVDLGVAVTAAFRAAKTAGVTAPVTLTRPAPPPHPTTGVQSGSALTQPLDVVQDSARKHARRGDAAWAQVSVTLFCSAAGLTFTPKVGDTVLYGGMTLRVVVVEDLAPTGAVVAYYLGCGG
jgi:hypothetical protein